MSNPYSESRPPLLKTVELTKLYTDGQVSALLDVSIEIDAGEYVSIMGPSGSGKSTLLNLLGALDAPTSGEIFFDGEPLSRVRNLNQLRAQNVGFVFQSFYLLPVLTAMENVQVPMFEGTLPVKARAEKAVQLLETVGLGHRIRHLPDQLSVGERQRVAVARALANDPVLLLADEPTGNLDSKSAAGIFDLFAKLHEERGMTIVLITHDDNLGLRAKRIIRMQDGRVRCDGRNPGLSQPDPSDSVELEQAAPSAANGTGYRAAARPKNILPPFAIPER